MVACLNSGDSRYTVEKVITQIDVGGLFLLCNVMNINFIYSVFLKTIT